jgi:hypothetical protein
MKLLGDWTGTWLPKLDPDKALEPALERSRWTHHQRCGWPTVARTSNLTKEEP